MSKGNNKTYGQKGNNHPYQFNVLVALGEIIAATEAAVPPQGGLATEATLISVLNAIVSSPQDVEILLVRDTGNANVVVQQITDYSGGGAPVVTYKDVNGTAYVPVGPLEYLDPAAVMNLVLAELITLNATDFATETTLASLLATDFATETTLAAVLADTTSLDGKDFATEVTLAALLAAFNSEDFATETTLAALAAEDFATETTLTALAATDFATETTLAALAATDFATETTVAAILADTDILSTPVTGLAAGLIRATVAGAATVAAGKRRASFANVGNTDASVAGGTLKRGEVVTFVADGLRDTLAAIPYNALTSELLITTVG
jgi:hypothetical protein